jgi:hypothetical protein
MLKQTIWIACLVAIVSGAVAADVNQVNEPSGLTAKRIAPPTVDPVVIGKLRFEVIHWGKERGLDQNGGYIAAIDTDSGKELWVLKIYSIPYDKTLESDVQDVFIKSMSKAFFSDTLTITDEKDRYYKVNPDNRTVEPK